MKNIIMLLGLSMVSMVAIANADECVSSNQSSVTQNGDKFILNVPTGYTLLVENSPINTATGTINFMGAILISNNTNNVNDNNVFAVKDIECLYGINPTGSGTYSGGIFTLTKNNSQSITYNLSNNWSKLPDGLAAWICGNSNDDPSACSFTPPSQ